MSKLIIVVPIKLDSIANVRMGWRKLAATKRGQKNAVAVALFGKVLPPLPAKITLVRIGARILDDDNLAHAFKAVRDQIAAAYGEDDGSTRYTWLYGQRIVPKTYEIEITIEERT